MGRRQSADRDIVDHGWPWPFRVIWLLKSRFEHCSITAGKFVTKFLQKLAWVDQSLSKSWIKLLSSLWNKHRRVTLSNICRNTYLTIPSELKHLGWRFWSRSMFSWSKNPMVPFIVIYDLDLYKITFWATFWLLIDKTSLNFNRR